VRRLGYAVDALLIAVAGALAIRLALPFEPWVERHYSNGAYPGIDAAVRWVSGPLPFTLGDVLFLAAVTWLLRYWWVAVRHVVDLRRRRWPAIGRIVLRTFAIAAGIFLWFEVAWALNYARVPLADKIPVHNERTDEDSVGHFADMVNDKLSALADVAHAHPLTDAQAQAKLAPRLALVWGRLGNDDVTYPPPRIKPTLFQFSLALSGSNGFTDPWTHEVNLDATLFPFERPAIFAHEWSHIAGFADETEANFISAIACTTSKDPWLEYSGWILVWENLPQNVHLTHRMGKTAYRDIEAIRARYLRQVNKTVEKTQRAAYDQYLKSNHVKAGYASYRLFIRWMTGADYDKDGLPIAKRQ